MGVIVCTPAAGIAKTMRSAAAVPLAARIALRSEPAPALLVLLTVNVAAWAEPAAASAKMPAPTAPASFLLRMSFPFLGVVVWSRKGTRAGSARLGGWPSWRVGALVRRQGAGLPAEVVQRRAVHR